MVYLRISRVGLFLRALASPQSQTTYQKGMGTHDRSLVVSVRLLTLLVRQVADPTISAELELSPDLSPHLLFFHVVLDFGIGAPDPPTTLFAHNEVPFLPADAPLLHEIALHGSCLFVRGMVLNESSEFLCVVLWYG